MRGDRKAQPFGHPLDGRVRSLVEAKPLVNKLLEQADSARLCFKSHEDAVDHAGHLVDYAKKWLTLQRLDIGEGYRNVDLEMRIRLRSMRDGQEWNFIVHAIQNEGSVNDGTGKAHEGPRHRVRWNHRRRRDHLVFMGVADFVYCDEKIIPSFVWLERDHEVEDFGRQVFRSSGSTALDLDIGSAKGEVSIFPLVSRTAHCNSKSGLVKRQPQVVDRVESERCKREWQRLGELYFVDICSWRFELHGMGATSAINELLPLGCE